MGCASSKVNEIKINNVSNYDHSQDNSRLVAKSNNNREGFLPSIPVSNNRANSEINNVNNRSPICVKKENGLPNKNTNFNSNLNKKLSEKSPDILQKFNILLPVHVVKNQKESVKVKEKSNDTMKSISQSTAPTLKEQTFQATQQQPSSILKFKEKEEPVSRNTIQIVEKETTDPQFADILLKDSNIIRNTYKKDFIKTELTNKIVNNENKKTTQNKISSESKKNELYKEQRQTILNLLITTLNKHKIPEGEIHISIQKHIKYIKDDFSKFAKTIEHKFSLLKSRKEIKWEKKPYLKVMEDIEEFFNRLENEDFREKFYNFDWSSSFQLYEQPSIKGLTLKNLSNYSEELINLNTEEENSHILPMIIFFLPFNDLNAINKLNEISTFLENEFESECCFFPIICERVNNKKDAMGKLSTLRNLNISLENIYGLEKIKKQRDPEEISNYIQFISDDNMREGKSILVVFDSEGNIRFLDQPHQFSVNSLYFYSNIENKIIDKQEYIKIKLTLETVISKFNIKEFETYPCSGHICFTKVKIFDQSGKCQKRIYNQVDSILEYNDRVIEQLQESIGDYMSVNYPISAYNKLPEKASSICKIMKETLPDEILQIDRVTYNFCFNIEKNYHINQNKDLKFFPSSQSTSIITMIGNLNNEEFDFMNCINSSLIEVDSLLKTLPQIPKVKQILFQPQIGSTFPEEINLISSLSNENELIKLEQGQGRIFIIIAVPLNDFETTILKQKLDYVSEELKKAKKDQLILIIHQNTSLIDNNIYEQNIQIIQQEPIFSQIEKYYFLNKSNTEIYFQFEFAGEISEENFLSYIMIDSENTIIYSGNGENVDFSKSLKNNLNSVCLKNDDFPVDKEIMKNIFKMEMGKFVLIIESMLRKDNYFYKPVLKLKYSKQFSVDFESEAVQSHVYRNFSITLILKSVNEQFLQSAVPSKYLKKWEGDNLCSFKSDLIKCLEINIEKEKLKSCSKCKKSSLKLDDEKLRFFHCPDLCEYYCVDCEKLMNIPQKMLVHSTNLIYFQLPLEYNNNILKEIIDEFYNTNPNAETQLDNKFLNPICSLCDRNVENDSILWLSLIHYLGCNSENINNFYGMNISPVFICDVTCFNKIINCSNSILKKKMKYLGFDQKYYIFKKLILPMNNSNGGFF
jgi:hypothetical protein